MLTSKQKEPFKKVRSAIGGRLRGLRESRQWTQGELSKRLHLSQARLSQIERGLASLTAEQLVEVLKIFNVGLAELVGQRTASPLVEIQNALARLGAPHLRVSEQVLPSEHLTRVQQVIFETVVAGAPRLLTALAPVLVNNAEAVNVAKLSGDLEALGLRPRLYWIIENTIEAIRLTTTPSAASAARDKLAARRLQTAMRLAAGNERGHEGSVDLLDPSIRSERSVDEVRHTASDISRRWGIITNLQPADFAAALRQARAGDQSVDAPTSTRRAARKPSRSLGAGSGMPGPPPGRREGARRG